MVERCSNGVAFVVLEPEPSIRTGIRVEIYDGATPATLLDVLSDTWGRQWTDPLQGPGSGRFSLYALDPKLLANPDLLAYGNIARFVLDGVDRFAITIEKRTLTQLAAGDDAARVLTVEGRGVLAKLEESVVYPAGGLSGETSRFEDPATAGDVMRAALLEAQARGAAHAITPPSATLDANNAPYTFTLELAERAGTDLLRVAERHAEVAVDVAMTVDLQLLYYNTRGVDRTVQTTNVGPVELRPGRNLVALERDETGAIRNALLVETPGGYLERIEGASVSTYRRREAFLSLGNTTSSDQVDLSAAAVFRRSADPAAEIGAEVLDVDGARPYVDWGIGDWVLAPDETGALTRYRVRALTVAETPEGRPTFVPELATITEELDARLERWLKAMARGTLSGEAGAVAERNETPPEVVEAIAADIDQHTAAQPHHDELSDLADVDVTGLTDDDALRYDAGSGEWVPVNRTLDQLITDVNAPSPAANQVLAWHAGSGEWRPATPSAGGGSIYVAKGPWSSLDPTTATDPLDDLFDDASLDAKWTPRQTGAAATTWTERTDGLYVHRAAQGGWNISALMQPIPDEDFTIEIGYTTDAALQVDYHIPAALLISSAAGTGSPVAILGPRFSDSRIVAALLSSYSGWTGNQQDIPTRHLTDGKLRFIRSGGNWTFQWSRLGHHWHSVRNMAQPWTPVEVGVALNVENGTWGLSNLFRYFVRTA